MPSSKMGALLVAIAAMLWATDALFRLPTVNELDPTIIVLAEHLVGLAVLLPWVLIKRRKELFSLTYPQLFAASLIGIGGSAFATVFFTASFRYINPSVAILLQKLQPLLVVLLAALFLHERPSPRFFGWALIALASAIVLSFPDLNFDFARQGFDVRSKGVIYAATAAGLWAVSTVLGKHLLKNVTPSVVTFWRFAFAVVTLLVLILLADATPHWKSLTDPKVMESLGYMGLVPGLIALMFYYQGMKRTSASTTTIMELLFPVGAVALNAIFLHSPLSGVQLGAGAVLLFAVTQR